MSEVKPTAPLIWLRSFEAAGRLLSFKDAAAEISVSPSTVSHQIRDLESLLGFPLFERSAKGIVLTDEGRKYLDPIETGFTLIRSAASVFEAKEPRLKIGAFPFLANEVFAPNLQLLNQRMTDQKISLHTQTQLGLLQSVSADQRLDVIICYGNKTNPRFSGLLHLKLFDITMVPIQVTGSSTIDSALSLMAQPIIRVSGPFDGWGRWAKQYEMASAPLNVVLETDSFHAAALAVERGEGICLGILPYMKPWIEQHRVTALMELGCAVDEAAYLVFAPHNKGNPAIVELHRWLQEYLA